MKNKILKQNQTAIKDSICSRRAQIEDFSKRTRSEKSKKTIFIIEDQELLLTLLRDELTAVGYEVLISRTGEDGLMQLKQNFNKIDLLILDLVLPKMDGFSVLDEMRRDERFHNIKIIILSNLGEESNVKKALSLGAIDYLIKADMTPDKIINIVNKIESKL